MREVHGITETQRNREERQFQCQATFHLTEIELTFHMYTLFFTIDIERLCLVYSDTALTL